MGFSGDGGGTVSICVSMWSWVLVEVQTSKIEGRTHMDGVSIWCFINYYRWTVTIRVAVVGGGVVVARKLDWSWFFVLGLGGVGMYGLCFFILIILL